MTSEQVVGGGGAGHRMWGEQGVGCGCRSRESEVLTVIGEEAVAIDGEELVAGGDHILVMCATLRYATITRIPVACAFSAREY
jgi:hypothetical protein